MSELPYEAEPGEPIVEKKPVMEPPLHEMQYLECYRFVFSSPNWGMNLLLGSVCMLIPVVGQIVFIGYEFELFEALHRGRREGYADFDFNRFGDYLKRGVWPWLAAFLAALVIQLPLFFFTYACAIGGFFAVMSQTTEGNITAVVLACIVFFVFCAATLLGFVITPIVLRAGLMQEFGKAFDFAWAKQFVKMMWVEQLLAAIFFGVTSTMLILLGEMMCFVGIYPAIVIVSIASIHILWQFYEIYLSRGGEPIPIKEADGGSRQP